MSEYQMPVLSQEELSKSLHYDPLTGIFTRRKTSGGQVAGSVAGSINSEGYRSISVLGRSYKAARLAHLYITGKMPIEADHKNRIRSDDRWVNLRCANHSQNACNKHVQKNNTSGFKGVCWHKTRKLWVVQVSVNSKRIQIGGFPTLEMAVLEAEKARLKYYGEFA